LKNQWFGDKHDYFKYDLWLDVAEKVEGIKKLTFIPMLTASEAPYERGKRRERLYTFLHSFCLPECRSVTRMRDFLRHERFEYHPYRDDDEAGFQDGSWNAYFNDVPQKWLRDAAILIDPDTGLETKSRSWQKHPEKYVTYKNVADVVQRCSGNSLVLVFQFLQRNAKRREGDLKCNVQTLNDRFEKHDSAPISVCWIAERTSGGVGDLAFIVVGMGSETQRNQLSEVLRGYERIHNLELDEVEGAHGRAPRAG
jgi:hypothetical protein